MDTTSQQNLRRALDQIEEFILRHRERALQLGRMDAWDRDWSFLKNTRALINRFDKEEMKHFLNVDFRGLSHYFGSYCDDTEIGKLLDLLYHAFQSAVLTEPLRTKSNQMEFGGS